MIECDDIQRAVGKVLKGLGFSVAALETQEGAAKPFCCIEVFPSESERVGHFIIEDTFSVSVLYYPKIETNEELLAAAVKIKKAVLAEPLLIDGRTLETFKVSLDRSGTVLGAEFEYTVEQMIDEAAADYDAAAELNIAINEKG